MIITYKISINTKINTKVKVLYVLIENKNYGYYYELDVKEYYNRCERKFLHCEQ